MNILIIDNAALAINNGRVLTNALNGIFIDDLIKIGNKISYCQFVSNTEYGIKNYDLGQHGVKIISLKLFKNKTIRYLIALFKIIKCLKKVDFVYFYYPSSFKYFSFVCRLLRKPYGLYIRGMYGLNDGVSKVIYKKACVVFTVSDSFTKMVNTITNKETAHTIRPMIPYTDADVVIGRNYESKETYNILFLGRIAKDKGLTELLEAAKRLHVKKYKFKINIVGDGEFSQELRELLKDRDLKNIISFDGPIFDNRQKAQCYQNADIYVLPTYHEGFPRTLYEAMIFGTPIVTTFVGGIPALMKDGENSKRIEPQSADSIVDGLSYAMNNYDEMGRMAKNASALVSKIVDRNRLTHAQHLNQILQSYGK